MNPDVQPIARALMIFGAIVFGCGAVLLLAPRIPWLGRLPGDVAIQREGYAFYFPLTSCLLVSGLLSALLWCVRYFRS